MRIICLLLCALLQVNADNPPCTASLYPHGPANGDTVTTLGDDNHIVSYTMYTDRFFFYGSAYEAVNIGSNGPFAFDNNINSFYGSINPSIYPMLAAFWDDVELDGNLGQIEYRMVRAAGVEFTGAGDDLARAGFNNVLIDSMIIVTWNGVQEYGSVSTDPQTTFQVILVMAEDCSLYAIFNYEEVNWALPWADAVINKGNDVDIFVLPISNNMTGATTYTNIDCPGRAVFRVDDENLSQDPSRRHCPTKTCVLKADGNVIGYEGNHNLSSTLRRDGKSVLTSTKDNLTDSCKFRVAAFVGYDRDVDWVVVNVGVHSNPTKHKRSYYFNQFGNDVVVKGQGFSGGENVPLPHNWSEGETTISIVAEAGGWTLTGVGCDYRVHVDPTSTDFATVTLTDQIFRPFIGACGDTFGPF